MKSLWLVAFCVAAWVVVEQGWATRHDIDIAIGALGALGAFELWWKHRALVERVAALEAQAKKRTP